MSANHATNRYGDLLEYSLRRTGNRKVTAHGSTGEPSRLERFDPLASAIVRKLMQSR